MKIRFLHKPWPQITKAIRRAAGAAHVGVAYLGRGGSELLPLKRGSTLVVDASDASVRAGRTCPDELLKLFRRGVRVFTVDNLHAKVFVTPGVLFVGSANASRASANNLLEAALMTTHPSIVTAAREWVESLAAVELGDEYLRRLALIYRPPKFALPAGVRGSSGRAPTPRMERALWLIKTTPVTWDADDKSAHRRGLGGARKALSDRKRFEVDAIAWHSTLKDIAKHDTIVVVEEEAGREYVLPPGRVLNVTPYGRGRRRIIFFERPRVVRRRSLERVQSLLSRVQARRFKQISGSRIGRSWAFDLARAAGGRTIATR